MKKKPVYCDCEKTPGGVLELEGDFAGMIHAKCGGKIVMPSIPERRPVFCAHPALEAEVGNRTLCLTCHSVWINGEHPPQVAIAYFEAGEDGGK